MKLNIAIGADIYDSYVTGASRNALNTSRELAKRGNRVLVFSSGIKESYEGVHVLRFPGIKLPFTNGYASLTVPNVFKIYNALLKHKIDIVFLHYPSPLCAIMAIAARALNIPVAIISHTQPENILQAMKIKSKKVRDIVYKGIILVYNLADVILCQTEFSANVLKQQGLRKPVVYCGGAVPLQQFKSSTKKEQDRVRQKYHISKKPVALFVGRLANEKRLDVLVAAIPDMIKKHPDLQVLIVGSGPVERKLKAFAKRLRLQKHITFTGFVPENDLAPLYHVSDVFILPLEVELLSLATLHAMAAKKPVLVSDSKESATPSLVQGNGELFQAGSAKDLARKFNILLKQDLTKLGKKSAKIAGPHDIQKTIDQYEAVFQKLVDRQKRLAFI